jgi:L-glutamine-phosphate cytidylyltransferase
MILVILAAGRGKRLGLKTKKMPKCLVEINGKSLINYNKDFINRFKKVVIVTGYKDHLIKNNFKENKSIIFIKNQKYLDTNMVYSLFCAYKYLKKYKEDIVISYSDIVFDKSIFSSLKSKGNFLIVYSEWLKIWKLRMKKSMIFNDAESLVVKKNILISIGQKIIKKIPKYQYTGIIKLRFNGFMKLYKYFKVQKNNKIDFTTFLNSSIYNGILEMKVKKTKKFWFEVDNLKDANVLTHIIKKNKFSLKSKFIIS